MLSPKPLILLLWFIAIICINPIGEFPLNDDWAFSKNVYNLVENGKFVVDDWPAMNLVSQTIYGSVFAFVFGFSFTVLRFSILLLAIIASLTLYNIIKKLSDGNKWTAFYITVTFCFSILFFSLSLTFMTDIFFLSFVIFSFDQIIKYCDTKRFVNYLFSILFCVIAVLNRQHGLLLPILIIGPVCFVEKSLLKKYSMMILPIILCWLASDKYRHYLTSHGISHGIQNFQNLVTHIKSATFSEHLLHAGDMLLVAGWILIPLNILLISQFKDFNAKNVLKFFIILIFMSLIVYKVFPLHPLGNISGILEVGPRVVKQDSPRLFPEYFGWLKIAESIISFISISVAIFFLTMKNRSTNKTSSNSFFLKSILLFILVYFIFVSLNHAYFDRYVLPFVLLVSIYLVTKLNSSQVKLHPTLIVVVFLVYTTTIFENIDFFNWQKNRWKALSYLENKGITSHEIDGGFEYNGWYKPNKFYPTDERSWWWVDKDNYVVTNEQIENFKIDTVFTFHRFLPYIEDSIYILKK